VHVLVDLTTIADEQGLFGQDSAVMVHKLHVLQPLVSRGGKGIVSLGFAGRLEHVNVCSSKTSPLDQA